MITDEEKGYFTCPNCGNKITDAEVTICENCTYDFSTLIKCSFIDDDKFCTITDKPCHVKGLDYYDCRIYQDYSF